MHARKPRVKHNNTATHLSLGVPIALTPAAEKGGSPANNGQGAEAPAAEEGGMPAYDHSKSPKENKEIREAWKKAHQV